MNSQQESKKLIRFFWDLYKETWEEKTTIGKVVICPMEFIFLIVLILIGIFILVPIDYLDDLLKGKLQGIKSIFYKQNE